MSLSINTNLAATRASNNLRSGNAKLQQSLERLSSGSKIVNPADDAGGLAVAMKMAAAVKRQGATSDTLANAQSYLQTQDGVLKTAGEILDRMSELKTLNQDVTKNASDKGNYNTEFSALQQQLSDLAAEKFNGIDLFGSETLTVHTTADGSEGGSLQIGGVDLLGVDAALFDTFNDPLSDGSAFGTSVVGGIGGNVNISGGSISLNGATGAIVSATTNDSFTGPVEITFDMNQNGVTGAVFAASYAGQSFYSRVNESGTNQVRMVYDGSEINVFLNGSSSPSNTISGVSGLSGQLRFDGVGGVGGVQQISNLSVQSTNPAGEVADVANAASLDAVSLDTITEALADVATYRAKTGAQQSRISFASEMVTTNMANLEAAKSRILDVDVAEESTQLARANILIQAGSSMLTQANQSGSIALRLLG